MKQPLAATAPSALLGGGAARRLPRARSPRLVAHAVARDRPLRIAEPDGARRAAGLLEVALLAADRVVRIAERLERDVHRQVLLDAPTPRTVLRREQHHGRVVHHLRGTVVDDVPPAERLAATQREVGHRRVGGADRRHEVGRQVGAAAVGERHASLGEVHAVERVGPPVVRAETHPCERAEAGVRVDEVEVVALAPGGVIADRMEHLVGGVGASVIRSGHRDGVAASAAHRRITAYSGAT